jgi:hypothetical protein
MPAPFPDPAPMVRKLISQSSGRVRCEVRAVGKRLVSASRGGAPFNAEPASLIAMRSSAVRSIIREKFGWRILWELFGRILSARLWRGLRPTSGRRLNRRAHTLRDFVFG